MKKKGGRTEGRKGRREGIHRRGGESWKRRDEGEKKREGVTEGGGKDGERREQRKEGKRG